MKISYPLKITKKVRETDQAVSLFFELPDDVRAHYRFKAGQYLTLETEINGQKIQRPYSLSTAESSTHLKVTIKAITGGVFSNYATDTLQVGDTLTVSTPMGAFVLPDAHTPQNYLAFVAGSGVTPVFSMVETLLTRCEKSTFTLVYGNKTPAQTIFFERLNTLSKKYPDRLKVFYVYSQIEKTDAIFGRIDEHIAEKILQKISGINDVFLCGPAQMIHNLREFLIAKNFTTAQIHHELFFNPNAEKKDTAYEKNNATKTNEKITATFILDDEQEKISFAQNQTLLEALLENDLDAPYSCKGGVCSSCMARVTSGKATMTKNNLLDEDEVAEGLILTCIAHAQTDEITLDFDDV